MGDLSNFLAYKKAFELAMENFHVSKTFPSEEKFSLTNQIRRSSRSVCANIGEAYRRRRYKDYFSLKLNDAASENTETQIWLDFSFSCEYILKCEHRDLTIKNTEIGKLIWFMINNPEKFM